MYQLGAGLAYLEKVGLPRIEAHTVSLAHQLRDGLVARGFDLLTPPQNRSSIVSVRNPAAAGVAQRTLRDAGIEVSFRENGTQIRVSPALFNTSDDVAAVPRAVDPLAPRRR